MKPYKTTRNDYYTFIIICTKKELKKVLERLVTVAIKTSEIESFNLTGKVVCLDKGNIFKFITEKEYSKRSDDGITRTVYVHGWALNQILTHFDDYPKFNIIEELLNYCENSGKETENEKLANE
jgi:hypothetical protein